MSMVMHACDTSTQEWRQEDLNFKVIFKFKANLGDMKPWVGTLREKTTGCEHRLK